MTAKQNIIEINGRRYDATTGQPVAGKLSGAPKVIDGFHASSSKRPAPVAKRAPVASHKRTLQKSQTLHRAAVRNSTAKSQSDTGSVEINDTAQGRLARAQRHQKSSRISKFGTFASSKAQPIQNPESAPVQAAPIHQPAQHVVATKPAVASAQTTKPQTNMVAPAKPKRTKRLAAHKPKFAAIAAGAAAVLVLASYFTYLNVPNVALRIAASRAGMDASVPDFQPPGYAFAGPASYGKGQLTLKYDSNSDDRSFNIVERESSWDSQSLLDNYVDRQHDQYLTFQERGLTVYVYKGNQASWVDGGVWYTIEGDAALNTEQLLKIAGSL